VTTPHTIWPEITSPAAHDVVQALFNMPYAKTDSGDYDAYPALLKPRELTYQRWVREQLAHSQLAQCIATGVDALPDLADSLPAPIAWTFRMLRPRALRDMPQHLVLFLEWYLNPACAEPLAQRALANTALFAAIGLTLLVVVISNGLLRPIEAVLLLLLLAPLPTSLVWMVGMGAANNKHKQQINATELYWYLRQAYGDPNTVDTVPRG
jgi:hypothetical protein